jgi:murein L,D-transpeptidase YcbB/YkuD
MTFTLPLRPFALSVSVALSSGIWPGALSPGLAQGAPLLASAPAADRIAPFAQAVAAAAAEDADLAAFYRARDYRPVWTSAEDAGRRAALFAAFDHAADQGLAPSRYGADDLRTRFRSVASERQRGQLEVAASRAFLTYARDLTSGMLDPKSIDAGLVRTVTLRDRKAMLGAMADAPDPVSYLRGLVPDAPEYTGLARARLDLIAAIAAGGWGPEVGARSLAPGDTGPEVVALRNRLVALGYMRPTALAEYDGTLQKAVQAFQMDNGIEEDGQAGPETINAINTSPETRLASVLVAMERLRWMNGLDLGRRHIWVNLPDFTAKIVDDGKVTFETVTVVGMNQADRRSPEFSDQMEFMVINPTWNVPRSITVKEYLPMLQRNPNAAGHLRIVDRRGRLVPRDAVDFTQFNERNFPFSMSQPPSDGNALGLVKFMFPNQWNIYLHDTPSKSLFKKDVRAFSHGCIRLGRPFDFAYALLAPQVDDPKAEFQRHLDTGRESTLMLKEPVPVHLVYFTAWPNARGRIEYRRDVYGRDARIFDALRAAGVELPAQRG